MGRVARFVGVIVVLAAFGVAFLGIGSASEERFDSERESAVSARNPAWAALVDKNYNLYRVTPTFYRSAQFDGNFVPLLKALNIRTVVSLRGFHSDEELLKDTGITLIGVPIFTWDIDDEEVVAALRAIRRAQNRGPVLLHCQHGADRTGLVTALYRIIYQGWTREQALDELRNGGYGYHAIWRNIPRYIDKVDVEKIRREVDGERTTD